MSKSAKSRVAPIANSASDFPKHQVATEGSGEFVLYTFEDELKRLTKKNGGRDASE